MTRKEQLKADLLKNFSDFQKIDPNVAPGGSDAANSIVASGLAESIDRAIDDGVEFRFQGVFAVKDINAIQEKAPGYLYTCSDSGILKAKTELPVVKNTVVLWNGEDFKTFLVIPEATGSSVQISVDSFLSTLSGNPVQNKVVTTAINALSAALASEAASRADADTALGGRIDAEATARENADAALQGIIDAEANARESADDTLDARIDGEETAREDGDRDLQAQIDAISSRSDVVDVVASHVELMAYDTSKLADNDVIKVLADETHAGAIAYYRWITTTEAWSFVGSQGPYYTISEADELLLGKVDKVAGKGLSTNDFTTNEKNKLAGIEAGADKSPVKFFDITAKYSDIVEARDAGYKVFLIGYLMGEYPYIYTMVSYDSTNNEILFAAMRGDYTVCTIKKTRVLDRTNIVREYPLAPKSHASTETTHGVGNASNYGHLRLSDSTSDSSGVNGGRAATPSAVKAAYELANSKADADGSNASGTWEAMSRGVSGKYLDISSGLVRLGTLTSSGQSVSFSLLISIQTNQGYPRKALYLASVSWRLNQDRANLSLVCVSTTPSNFTKTSWGKCTLGIDSKVSGAGLYLLVETLVSNLRMTCAMLHTGSSGGFSVELQNIASQVSFEMSADEVGVAFVPYNTAVGSASRPVYSNSAGELKPCDLIINNGSHPTVTLDFSGTLGSNLHTLYWV